jgi:hypothetical protein
MPVSSGAPASAPDDGIQARVITMERGNHRMKLIRGSLPRTLLAGALTAAFVGTGCDGLLDVSDPSRYLDEALDDPRAFEALANGVEGRLHSYIDAMVINTGLLSDELMHTGTWTQYEDMDLGRLRSGDALDYGNVITNLPQIRREAVENIARFRRVLGDSEADQEVVTARMKSVEAWATLLMAQYVCEAVLTPSGPAVSDVEVYNAAIPLLTEALQLAQGSGATQYVHLARAGRARANLMVGNYDAAMADAQAIPDGYIYYAKFSDQGANNRLVTLNHYSENKAAGLDERRFSQVDTIAGYLLDHASGELDPRVKIVHRVGNRLGVDGVKLFYSQDKYALRADDIPMTHWQEMRLIEAEVHWNRGEFQQAIDKMNIVRDDVGLPPLDNPDTSQGVLDLLLEERFATLFLEGQRANDLYRFNLFPEVIGTGFNTKYHLPSVEVRNNPNTPEPRPCPAIS